MKILVNYLWRVLKWTFSGADAIAKTIGVIALYVVDFKFPQLPWEVLAGATALLVLNATFAVWNEERKEAVKYKSKLADLKSKIPTYKLHGHAIKKYSVTDLIAKYENQVTALGSTPPQPRSLSPYANLSASITRMISANASVLGAYGVESNDDKIERLKEHIENLKDLEDLLECTYAIELDIESTRSDDNILVHIRSTKPAIFVLEDDFVNRMLPHTEEPPLKGALLGTPTATFLSNEIPDYVWPNIKKPRGSIHKGVENEISETIDHLNADYKASVFEDEFWIQSEESDIELEFSINSSLRHIAQKTTKTISVQDIPTEQITE